MLQASTSQACSYCPCPLFWSLTFPFLAAQLFVPWAWRLGELSIKVSTRIVWAQKNTPWQCHCTKYTKASQEDTRLNHIHLEIISEKKLPEKKEMLWGEDAFYFISFNQELQAGKTAIGSRVINFFIQGWSRSKPNAKPGYKAIARYWGQREKGDGKGHFCLKDWGVGQAKRPKSPWINPLEIWKFSPQAHLWDMLPWASGLRERLFCEYCSSTGLGQLCPAVIGPIAPIRTSATG